MRTSKLLVERIGLFPSSGNIYIKVKNSTTAIKRIQTVYVGKSLDRDESYSGLSLVFTDWRFKLHVINPHSICLCVESRGDSYLLQIKTAELLANISCTEDQS